MIDKHAILSGIKAALLADGDVNTFSKSIHIISGPAALKSRNLGLIRMILLQDGGAVKEDESTNSAIYSFTVNVVCIEPKGDLRHDAPMEAVTDAIKAVCIELDRNTAVYSTASVWIEQARAAEAAATEEIWADLTDQATKTPFVMAAAVIQYRVYRREI